jgi:hypothetical protein
MKRKGQSVTEYFIIMTVVLAAILATGFIDNIRGVFRNYFTKAADAITVNR